METAVLKKALYKTIGRNFNLVFNQVAMYNARHKSGARAIDRFFESLTDGLKLASPLAISIHQEQFRVEEEPFEPSINTSRMAAHFSKVGIESISFEKHLTREDLTFLLEVVTDLNTYASIDAMKKALAARSLTSVRLNYVTFRKITDEEAVIKRDLLNGETANTGGEELRKDDPLGGILDMMVANIVSDEVGKNITLDKMMAGTAELSTLMIASDLAAAEHPQAQGLVPGTSLQQGLQAFRQEVDAALVDEPDLDMADLARGVFELKNKLIRGIEEQKAKGVVYVDEASIRSEADDITDRVLVKLIVQEYRQGAVTVKRLAGIILRLVPASDEMKRILPKAKEALLKAGMRLSEYLLLVQELKEQLQSDELTRALERGASEIGLDGEDLVREIMDHPEQAAELICLAAEVRKTGDDDNILSELLVDYVERIGTGLAVSELEGTESSDGGKTRRVFSRIRSELLDSLKQRDLDAGILSDLEKRLTMRMEESLRLLQSRMLFKQVSKEDARDITKDAMLKMLRSYSDDEREFDAILDQVKSALSEKGMDSEHFNRVYDEMLADMEARQTEDPARKAPAGTLNRQSSLFVLENEVKRSLRYDTPFALLSFSILRAVPQQAGEAKDITLDDVVQAFMTTLLGITRETDVIGRLSLKMVMVMLPMTEGGNAKVALERFSKALKSIALRVNGIPFDIQFAGVATSFDPENMPTLKALVKVAQNDLQVMATRLTNLSRMA